MFVDSGTSSLSNLNGRSVKERLYCWVFVALGSLYVLNYNNVLVPKFILMKLRNKINMV